MRVRLCVCVYIYISPFFGFPSHSGHHRALSRVPCAVQHVLIAVVQSLRHVWLFVTPMDCSTRGFPVLHYLLAFAQTHVHWVGDVILCHPLLLLFSILPSIRVISNELAVHIRWPKYRNFSFSINPSNEYSGLISFRIDWFDLLAVQGTLKSLLQHHNSKASIFQHAAFFIVQLSHPYVTTVKKTTALTRQTSM